MLTERGRCCSRSTTRPRRCYNQSLRATLFEDARALGGARCQSGRTARSSVPSPGGLVDAERAVERADAVGQAARAPSRASPARRPCRRRGPRSPASPFSLREPHGRVRGVGVLGDVRERLGDREVGRRLGGGREAVLGQRRAISTGTGARSASAEIAGARPRSVSTAGWMPRASSRSSADASASSLPRRSRNGRRGVRVLLDARARHPHLERQRDEPLLRAVVQVALDLAAGRVGGLDDARARRAHLLGAGLLDLALAQRLLGRAALGDVEDRAVAPQPPAGARDEVAAVEHPADLAVGADDPVLERERPPSSDARSTAVAHLLAVVGVEDAEQRPPLAGDEVRGRVAGDPLDLVADQLERVVGVPGRAVDRAGDVGHQRAHERVVGALLGGAQAGARPREQLGAAERAVQVVVGAGVERGVGRALLRGDRDREQPRVLEPRVARAARGTRRERRGRPARGRRSRGRPAPRRACQRVVDAADRADDVPAARIHGWISGSARPTTSTPACRRRTDPERGTHRLSRGWPTLRECGLERRGHGRVRSSRVRLIACQFPEVRAGLAARCSARAGTTPVWLVDGRWVFRFPRRAGRHPGRRARARRAARAGAAAASADPRPGVRRAADR